MSNSETVLVTLKKVFFSRRWLSLLKTIITNSFKKIRIKKSQIKPELDQLFNQKESLLTRIALLENEGKFEEAQKLETEVMDVELNIGNLCAEKNKLTVEELITREDTVDGISQAKIWRLKKKLVPKNVVLPSAAKKDEHGNLVSNKADLESLYLQTYKS